jgi:TIR domain
MNGIAMSNPNLFISYSWSNPDHEKWVLTFGEELISQGIDVVLDKWDLKPGHDANAFMEAMVTDPDVAKVVLVCDKQYVEKSNKRSGGAGAEAQIITPEFYVKKEQDKFVAAIREFDDDGKAYVPVYYGSRIYFDLSNPSTYATEFENLVRWAWDKPAHTSSQN